MKKFVYCFIAYLLVATFFLPLVTPKALFEKNISIKYQDKEWNSENYFTIIKYSFNGISYNKQYIQINTIDKDNLVAELKEIESLSLNIKEKNYLIKHLFEKYEIIHCDQEKETSKMGFQIQSMKNNNELKNAEKLLFSRVTGTFGPSFINLAHVAKLSPFFISIAKGVDFEIVNFPGRTNFQSDHLVKFVAIGVIGTILLLPFFSPFGYIDASVFLGRIKEIGNNFVES